MELFNFFIEKKWGELGDVLEVEWGCGCVFIFGSF